MSTRTSSALALLLLAACSRAPAEATPAAGGEDTSIGCALAGAAEFTTNCTVERVQTKDGLQLVVRHPDGGFRRFDVLTDGHGLAAADGAEEAKVTVFDDGIDVTVGKDRYRFPATVTYASR